MTASVASNRLASQRGTALVRDTVRPYRTASPTATAWVRPADWLAMPTLVPGTDRKVVALAAIFDNASNFFAVQVHCAGGYTVDWGDGAGPQTYATTVTASRTIAYSSVDAGTLSTRGYRQAIVTITPTVPGTDMTRVWFDVKHTSDTAGNGNPHMWLEIDVCSPGTTRMAFGPASAGALDGQAYNPMLEQIRFTQYGGSMTGQNATMDGLFSNCYSLQSIVGTVAGPQVPGAYSATGMFQNCYSLRRAPDLDMPYNSYAVNMFANCYSLLEVNLDKVAHLSSIADWGQCFQNCRGLVSAPRFALDGANSSSWSSTFAGCNNLENVPFINASRSGMSFLNNMFQNCWSLRNAPVMAMATDVGSSWSASGMFQNCYNLEYLPAYNWSRCNTVTNLFQNCRRLQAVPDMNLSNVGTNLNSLFADLSTLKSVGRITANSGIGSTNSMFSNCWNLESWGGFTNASLNNISSTTSMFVSCYNLRSVPDMNFGFLSNTSGMFQNCVSLITAPAITAGLMLNASSMFNGCSSLQTVPNYAWTWTTNGTVASMFQDCVRLQQPPSLGTTGTIVTWSSMFQGCTSLQTGGSWTTTAATNMTNMFNNCVAMQTAPAFSATAQVTNVLAIFLNCYSLIALPAYNFTGVSSAANITNWLKCPSLSRAQVANVRFTHTYSNNRLAAAQLDEIYTNLPTITAQTLSVTGNWGAATDTPSIATAKGWTVTGT